MKIEFIDDISDGGRFADADPNQLVRLFDFEKSEANKLREAIQKMFVENNNKIDVNKLSFIQTVNCYLTLKISDTDEGITTSNNNNFVCNLTIEKYKEIVLLMEPFCHKENAGYQWLYDLDTPIDFLFSPGGSW